MAIESATYVSQLNATLPTALDVKSEGDDQIRLVKAVLLASFPNVSGAVTATHTALNTVSTKATKTGDNYSGTHDFTAGAALVPTAAGGTSTTAAASTAFVQAAIASVNASGNTSLSVDSAASIAAIAGQHIVATNAGTVTVTLPASPDPGNLILFTPGNGRTDNVIARNGNPIMGLAEDMTINNANVTVGLRYINGTLGWRIV